MEIHGKPQKSAENTLVSVNNHIMRKTFSSPSAEIHGIRDGNPGNLRPELHGSPGILYLVIFLVVFMLEYAGKDLENFDTA